MAQHEPRAESYFRQKDGTWLFTPVEGLAATLPIRSVQIEVPLAEVYAGVTFPPQPEESAEPQ